MIHGESAAVYLFDAQTGEQVSFSIPTGPGGGGMTLDRETQMLYVTSEGDGTITVINVDSGSFEWDPHHDQTLGGGIALLKDQDFGKEGGKKFQLKGGYLTLLPAGDITWDGAIIFNFPNTLACTSSGSRPFLIFIVVLMPTAR